MRIDKYLWAVRVFKTRNKASQACKNDRVFVGEQAVKPSRDVKKGDIIQVKQNPVTYSYRVLGFLSKRVSAKLAVQYVEDVTPAEEKEKLEQVKRMKKYDRPKGWGRPTKKERRKLMQFKNKGLW